MCIVFASIFGLNDSIVKPGDENDRMTDALTQVVSMSERAVFRMIAATWVGKFVLIIWRTRIHSVCMHLLPVNQ